MRDRASADAAGFDAFFRSSSHRILTQAYLLTGSSVVAQDLTQEAFLRTWIHWPRISKFENPEAWALRVLHNLSVSMARSDKHRLTPIGTFEAIQPAIEDHLVLAAALRSLPRDQARALDLEAVSEVPLQGRGDPRWLAGLLRMSQWALDGVCHSWPCSH